MVKVGLTGGIGSGKSVVSRILSAMRYPVYDSDRNAARVMVSSPDVICGLKELIGENAYLPDGTLNKPVIAAFLYRDSSCREAVNRIVHPAVFRDFTEWCSRLDNEIVFVESAILFESGLDKFVDRTIMVYAPLEVRLKRVMQRDNIDENQALNRINSQMSDEDKLALCDYCIHNGPDDRIINQVYSLLNRI